ncbi:MAG: PilN domain-containing protein [Thermodesulfobacteriota bacterium]|nr:PilN domain-containing protein [Thermodesulfobacteriota bacterium]
MIRINLLPFRAARKKENVRRQISIYLLSVALLLALCGYTWWDKKTELARLKAEKIQLKNELDSYSEATKKIEALKKKIKQVRAKLDVIQGLEKNKTGPVLLLDELATAVPAGKLWLNSVKEGKGILSLSGTAMDNDTVALFMTNLEMAEHINSVDLKSTRLSSSEDQDVTEFGLSCKVYSYEEKPKKATKKRRGKKRR